MIKPNECFYYFDLILFNAETLMNDLRSQLAKQKRYDLLFVNATKAFAILVLLSLGGILVSLIIGAWPSIQAFGLDFIPVIIGIRSPMSTGLLPLFMAR